jgi:hypothetical protein
MVATGPNRTKLKRAQRGGRVADRIAALEAVVRRLEDGQGRIEAAAKAPPAPAPARIVAPPVPPVPPVPSAGQGALSSGQMQIFLGRLSTEVREHVDQRVQRLLEAQVQVAEGIRDGLQAVSADVRHARHVAAAGARRKAGRISVLFLVHFVEAWDALADVHDAMLREPDFDVTVGTLPRYRRDRKQFEYEDSISATLTARGVRHMRLGLEGDGGIEVVRAMAPDVIFRQTPWDADIPPPFRASELTFARLAYVPYGLYTAKIESHQYDQLFHRLLWRYYAPTAEDLALLGTISPLKGLNGYLSGYPKFDRLVRSAERAAWPIDRGVRGKRIIWAPHQSIGQGGLGFGDFPAHYRQAVAYAAAHPEIEFVFKPHPTLLDVCAASKLMSAAEIAWFEENWAALPNTATYLLDDYGPLFAASDAMITEGVSFFSEYMLFDRPLVFLDSRRHQGFNPATTFLPEGMVRAHGFVEGVEAALAALEPGGDTMAEGRRSVIRRLMPHPQRAAARIVEDIRRGLSAEARESAHGA